MFKYIKAKVAKFITQEAKAGVIKERKRKEEIKKKEKEIEKNLNYINKNQVINMAEGGFTSVAFPLSAICSHESHEFIMNSDSMKKFIKKWESLGYKVYKGEKPLRGTCLIISWED